MAPYIDRNLALLRGRYGIAVARMERAGVPIDHPTFQCLTTQWTDLRLELIAHVDAAYGVFEHGVFRVDLFEMWLQNKRIRWPRLPSGRLALNQSTFRDQAKRWPELQDLRELRATLGKLQLTGLTVGQDGRNRCRLLPFSSVTGRNQPSNSTFVFGPAKWMRGLIMPPPGFGLALIDFVAQEVGLAAGLSGDERLAEAYLSGDPYLAFAKQAGLVPLDATKESHPLVRERCKQVVLGVNYGMGIASMAEKAGISPAEAASLLRRHKETYRKFWQWLEAVVDGAMLTNQMRSVFGWRRRIGMNPNPCSLMNFPMQANGAETLRVAAIAGTEAGIEVCAPIHDAFLIAAPLTHLDEHADHMRRLMARAGNVVTGGLPINTEAKIIRYPDRYMDDRVAPLWNKITALLASRRNGGAA